MIVWLIVLIISAFLLGVLFLKAGLFFSYHNESFSAKLRVGGINFSFGKEEKTLREKRKKSGNTSTQPKAKNSTKHMIGIVIKYMAEILELAAKVLRRPTIDVLEVKVRVGDPDPVNCALSYGRICASVGMILPIVENTFKVRHHDVDVICLFDESKTSADAEVALTLRVYEIIVLLFAALKLGYCIYSDINANKKARNNI